MEIDQIKQIEDLINHGRYFEARTRAEELVSETNSARSKQLCALAISKSGNPQLALDYLLPLYSENPNDPEVAGILGGIYKELFKKHQDSKYAILSRDTYAKNFSLTQSYYTGINAATMSAIAGKAMQGREIANSIVAILENQSPGFWEYATLGEAYILTKNRERAVESYIRARQLAANDWGKVLSVHNQLWLLNHYLPVPKEVLRIFAPPEVVAFAGHMVDAPGRKVPRFPAAIEPKVKEAIRGAIKTLHASIGYCSLACGGDILFAEVLAEEGGEVHILMPFEKEEFIKTSLAFAGEEWVNRFENLLNRYQVTLVTSDGYGGNDDLFSLLGKIIFGSAILRSQTYHKEPYLLTVLSEFDLKQKEGGTRDTIQMWPYPQRYTNINPDVMFTASEIPATEALPRSEALRITNRPVLFIACIDISQLISIERERIEKLAETLIAEQQIMVKINKVMGDFLYLAIDTEITLMDIVKTIWNSTAPFKPEKPLRIGVHAAPVYLNTETDASLKFTMSITQLSAMGTLCASVNFAAVLALHPKKFSLDYVGVVKVQDSSENHGLYQLQFK